MGWREVAQRMRSYNLEDEVSSVINSTNEQLKELQKEQWREGKDKMGNPIARYRSRKYAEAKFGMNPNAGFGNWDMTLTGRLGNLLKITAINGQVWNRSDDAKYDKLAARVPNAFGLNKGYIQIYQGETLKPKLSQNFRATILR